MNSQKCQIGYQGRSMARRRWRRIGLAALILAAANVSPAQDESPANTTTFKTLLKFDAINGGNPGALWCRAWTETCTETCTAQLPSQAQTMQAPSLRSLPAER
jgi:hypothetical protein